MTIYVSEFHGCQIPARTATGGSAHCRGKERLPRYYATYAASAPRRGARLLRVLLEVLDLPGLVAVHERDLGRVRVAALLELKRYYTYM